MKMKFLNSLKHVMNSTIIEDLQNLLIIEKKEWVHLNIIYIHKISSKHQSFNLLQDYSNKLFSESPELFLKSNDISTIEKTMFISILERDGLEFNEIDI